MQRTPDSDHYSSGKFFNPHAQPQGFRELLRWVRTRQRGPWRKWTPVTPGSPPPRRLEPGALRATFVGHATVLLQIGELNLITDPVWSLRASPLSWLGPKRHRPPGIRFDDLPRMDVILLSHNHYDHLDTRTLRRLLRRDRPAICCPLGLGKMLRQLGFAEVLELDWWQTGELRGAQLRCLPAQHFSARTPFDRDRTLWCGWSVEHDGRRICFAGDTGFGPHFAEMASRLPQPDLALLPIGAYRPEWFMGPVHMNPDEALQAHRILQARRSLAIHFGTFSLADDGECEPPDRIRARLEDSSEAECFWILREGEGREVPASPERV